MIATARHEVIMPALGMTQDTGEIVSWHKTVGDSVNADDILFEVETDKTTMEVEAGFAGFVVEINANAGDTVPVGAVIAVISNEQGAASIDSGVTDSATSVDTSTEVKNKELINHEALTAHVATTQPAVALTPPAIAHVLESDGTHILASPKARLIAHQRGIDLTRLANSGISQPIQSIDVLRQDALPKTVASSLSLLQARIRRGEFEQFCSWTRESTDGQISSAKIWCVFATAAWRKAHGLPIATRVVVAAQQWSDRVNDVTAANADSVGLREIDNLRIDAPADLVLRDMSGTRFVNYESAEPSSVPTITITEDGADFILLSIRFDEDIVALDRALDFLEMISDRAEQPLRHLL